MTCTTIELGNKQTAGGSHRLVNPDRTLVGLPGGSGKFVQLYLPIASTNWLAVVGTVDANGDITYGTPVTSFATELEMFDIAAISATKIVLVYRDSNNDPASLVGTISGTDISFGSPQNVDTLYPYSNDVAVDPSTGKVLWIYAVSGATKCVAGTVNGTSMSWGTVQQIEATRRRDDTSLCAITSDKFLFFDSSSSTNKGQAQAFSVSGTTVSWGSILQYEPSLRCSNTSSAYDSVNAVTVAVHYGGTQAENNFEICAETFSVSGLVVTAGTQVQVFNAAGGNYPINNEITLAYDASTSTFFVAVGTNLAGDDPILMKAAKVSGGNIDFCKTSAPVFLDDPLPGVATAQISPSLTSVDANYVVLGWEDQDADDVRNVALSTAPSSPPECTVKPTKSIYVSGGSPGSPGFPGQPYIPERTVTGNCRTYTGGYEPEGPNKGTYEWVCTEYKNSDSLVIGEQPDPIPDTTTICTVTYRPKPRGTINFGAAHRYQEPVTVCDTITIPAQPYIAPTPPVAPTPAEYRTEYDLGWNYARLIGSGQNIGADITTDNVSVGTSGVVIGVCKSEFSYQMGLGKYALAIEFFANRVGVLVGGARVWGQAVRLSTDTYSIRRYENQIAVFKNDTTLIYSVNDFFAGEAYIMGDIYKGGDGFCITSGLVTSITEGVGNGGSDVSLPALGAQGYEGSYAVADVSLPALQGDASADAPWEGFGIGTLPGLSATGYQGEYGVGDAALPVFTTEGSGGVVLPEAQGADVAIPHLLGASFGYTGEVGTGNTTMPALLALASEGTYGDARAVLPALTTWAGQEPQYDGILNGEFEFGLAAQDMWGYVSLPYSLTGRFEALEGKFRGGGSFTGELGTLTGSWTGTAPAIGRLEGTFGRLELNVSTTVTVTGEIGGRLSRLAGDLSGGGRAVGELEEISGSLTGTVTALAQLEAEFERLTGDLTGTIEEFGVLQGEFAPLVTTWSRLDGTFAALEGQLAQGSYTVTQYQTWVVNSNNSAVTRYPDYRFDYLLRWQGKQLLVRDDGIYDFGGGDDNGTNIDSTWAFPESDYGTSREKRAPRFYLYGNLSGAFDVTVNADETTDYTVRSETANAGVNYFRTKMPRGVRGHTLKFTVANVNGADFEIEQADALLAVGGRKR